MASFSGINNNASKTPVKSDKKEGYFRLNILLRISILENLWLRNVIQTNNEGGGGIKMCHIMEI